MEIAHLWNVKKPDFNILKQTSNMSRNCIIRIRQHRPSATFSKTISFTHWTTKGYLKKIKDFSTNWCRSCQHESYVTTKKLLHLSENDCIVEAMSVSVSILEVVKFRSNSFINQPFLNSSCLLKSILDFAEDSVVESWYRRKQCWFKHSNIFS